MHLVKKLQKKILWKIKFILVQGQVTSVLAGAFAAILLTGTENQNLEIVSNI